jgi:hypothetical protein
MNSRCEAFEGLEAPGVILGLDEVVEVGSQLVVGFVVVALDGGVLEGAVHSLNLAVIRHDGGRRFHTLPLVGDMVRPSGLWGAGST